MTKLTKALVTVMVFDEIVQILLKTKTFLKAHLCTGWRPWIAFRTKSAWREN